VGIFRDGDEAIEFLSENDVDLVITDIKMARCSGIELAKYIYNNKPYINTIAVSAYSEFEYAKELMRYGVMYYLLKFVDLDEFLEAIDIVRSNITSRKSGYVAQYDELQTEMFFYDLFENNFSSCEEAAKNYYEIEKNISFENSCCKEISIIVEDYENFRNTKWKYTDEMFKNAVFNVVKLTNSSLFVTLKDFCDEKLNFLAFNHGNDFFVDTQSLEKELSTSFGIEINITVSNSIFLKDVSLGNYAEENEDNKAVSKDYCFQNSQLPTIVKSAIDIIEKNYNTQIIRSEIAEQIHINAIYLSKTFKKYTGKTLMTYLYECRMKKAMEYAVEGKTINEICELIGYTDERAFRRAFKKYTGCSVRDYKKSSFSDGEAKK